MQQVREFLPLGSVITLKDASKRLMIVGRLQKGPEDTIYDYSSVLWPEGLIRSDRTYLFDQEDIDRLWYIGLQDQEEFRFRNVLEEQDQRLKGRY